MVNEIFINKYVYTYIRVTYILYAPWQSQEFFLSGS